MTRKKHSRVVKKLTMEVFVVFLTMLVYLANGENIAMFTDNLVQDYRSILANQSYYIDGVLSNTSLVDRYESNKYCLLSPFYTATTASSSTQSIVKNLIQYSNYTRNTFESKKVSKNTGFFLFFFGCVLS